MSWFRLKAPAILVAVLVLPPTLYASCEERSQTVADLQQATAAGLRVFGFLERSGAEVAIVARVGSDQSKRGLKYTHGGLVWRDHPLGRWGVTHQLNLCSTDRSDIYDGGLVSFFLEQPFSYDALVVIPEPGLQARLAGLLGSTAPRAIHNPAYSALAHPFETRYQNSNGWMLELIGIALQNGHPPVTRTSAQRHLRALGFVPERTRLGFFERVGARRLDNVKLRDHRRSELHSGGYRWVSIKSILAFLEAEGLVESAQELRASVSMETELFE